MVSDAVWDQVLFNVFENQCFNMNNLRQYKNNDRKLRGLEALQELQSTEVINKRFRTIIINIFLFVFYQE